ncbi:hypothetical protein GWI33_007785 [Rhynchophorus ferrugineus]|uniref:Uncharacterized protein n=1 Tax=Rhynchophorus ferrugineus TaxID=354439 RepID=A0A834IJQ7_RHYFE|nr:hypothetical protein GWI33_007785 [Rhynchophorus ferrugineus]
MIVLQIQQAAYNFKHPRFGSAGIRFGRHQVKLCICVVNNDQVGFAILLRINKRTGKQMTETNFDRSPPNNRRSTTQNLFSVRKGNIYRQIRIYRERERERRYDGHDDGRPRNEQHRPKARVFRQLQKNQFQKVNELGKVFKVVERSCRYVCAFRFFLLSLSLSIILRLGGLLGDLEEEEEEERERKYRT